MIPIKGKRYVICYVDPHDNRSYDFKGIALCLGDAGWDLGDEHNNEKVFDFKTESHNEILSFSESDIVAEV